MLCILMNVSMPRSSLHFCSVYLGLAVATVYLPLVSREWKNGSNSSKQKLTIQVILTGFLVRLLCLAFRGQGAFEATTAGTLLED